MQYFTESRHDVVDYGHRQNLASTTHLRHSLNVRDPTFSKTQHSARSRITRGIHPHEAYDTAVTARTKHLAGDSRNAKIKLHDYQDYGHHTFESIPVDVSLTQRAHMPQSYDYTNMIRNHGGSYLEAFVKVNSCCNGSSFLDTLSSELETNSSDMFESRLPIIADETKLPIYIAAFGTGFFSAIICLCTVLYIKFIFGKIRGYDRNRKNSESSISEEHLLNKMDDTCGLEDGGTSIKPNLAQTRAENPYLTRIEDYMYKHSQTNNDSPRELTIKSASNDAITTAISVCTTNAPMEALDEMIGAFANFSRANEKANINYGKSFVSDQESDDDSEDTDDDEDSDEEEYDTDDDYEEEVM